MAAAGVFVLLPIGAALLIVGVVGAVAAVFLERANDAPTPPAKHGPTAAQLVNDVARPAISPVSGLRDALPGME